MENNNITIIDQLSAVNWQSFKSYTKIAVLVDENTKAHCYPLIQELLPQHILIEINSGEEQKTLTTCQHIWQCLTDHAFDRKSLMINLGGGVIGDMGGFCAATYKRGIDFIQVPTTLLAQVDASVGGKLGIDFQGFKNHIGLFRIPNQVIIYPPFLETLPKKELRSGYAEVIKHCLIKDKQAWKALSEKRIYEQDWTSIIPHSVSIKEAVVNEDPQEQGLRKTLNFGHTIGHAVETYFLSTESKLLHGEAIAIGMAAELYLSSQRDWISREERAQVVKYIVRTFGRIPLPEEHWSGIAELAIQDKKNEGGKIQAALLEGVGEAGFNHEISKEEIMDGLAYYAQLPAVDD